MSMHFLTKNRMETKTKHSLSQERTVRAEV